MDQRVMVQQKSDYDIIIIVDHNYDQRVMVEPQQPVAAFHNYGAKSDGSTTTSRSRNLVPQLWTMASSRGPWWNKNMWYDEFPRDQVPTLLLR
jgi:hypothetical protein